MAINVRTRRIVPTLASLSLAIWLTGAEAAGDKSITLNLKNADLSAVISTVSEVTGKNFIVDPRVKGKVTIVSSKPLDKDALYQVFLTVLDVHGFAAVDSGDIVKIIPDADAKNNPTPMTGEGGEIITQAISIRHVSAAQLVPILRPLVPPQGHMAAHTQTNTLIIADRAANIARLMKIIERIDEPSGSEIEVIQLKHAAAGEVVRILNALQQQTRKPDQQTMPSALVADERTNTILMGGEKNDRLSLMAIIAHLDTPSEVIGNTNVIYLKYAKAKDLVGVLTGVGTAQAKEQQKQGAPGAPPTQQAIFNIQADESSNALVITSAPDVYRSLESVIRRLDVRRAQVLVEAIIAEVSNTKTAELGVQWIAGGSNPGSRPIGISQFGSNGIVNMVATGLAAKKGAAVLPSIGPGLTLGVGKFVDGGYSFGAIINALAGDSTANLLSTPNILTMDNEEAEIFVGKEVSIPSGSYASTGAAGGTANSVNPFTTFKAKQVGVRLKVKPQINEGDAIKLELDQAVDSITAGSAGEANLVTSTRTIKTTVMIDDGQVVVLGGLITDNQDEVVQKVPLLGDLPLIGNLFRYKRNGKDKTNLLVFLRPQILRDSAVTSQLSGGKYNYMRAKELEIREMAGGGLLSGSDSPLLAPFDELSKKPVPTAPATPPQNPVVPNKGGTDEGAFKAP